MRNYNGMSIFLQSSCYFYELFYFRCNVCIIYDVNEYRKCVKELHCPLVNSLYDSLHALCNLLLVKPENLKQVCNGEQLVRILCIKLFLFYLQKIIIISHFQNSQIALQNALLFYLFISIFSTSYCNSTHIFSLAVLFCLIDFSQFSSQHNVS